VTFRRFDSSGTNTDRYVGTGTNFSFQYDGGP